MGTKPGKAVTLVALIAGVGLLLFSLTHRRSRADRLPIISILDHTQYMEELILVGFYSDQLVVLGDESKLEKQLDQAIQDSSSAFKKYESLRERKAEMEVRKQAQEKLGQSYSKELDSLYALRDSASRAYDQVDMNFKKFLAQTEGKSTSELTRKYNASIARHAASYDSTQQLNPSNHKGRKQKRLAEKKAESDLKNAFSDLKASRLATWKERKKSHQLKEYEQDQKRDKKTEEKITNRLQSLTTQTEEAKAEYLSARSKVNTLWEATEKAYKESEGTFDVKHPKLVVVVPCHLTTYIDLQKIKYDFQGDTMVTVTVDSIIMGEVDVLLDSAHYYDVAKRAPEVRFEREGLYQLIFEELRLQMQTINQEVQEKAISSGIMTRSCSQATGYFQNLMTSYGYKVKVVIKGKECG